MVNIISYLATALAMSATAVQAAPASESVEARANNPDLWYEDQFDTLDKSHWWCEGVCPKIEGGIAKFQLAPNTPGAQSDIIFTDQDFTWGIFRFSLSLSAQPAARVFWGASLYNNGPKDDGSQFSQIDFGFYTNKAQFKNSQLFLESAVLGQRKTINLDAGFDLYTSIPHTYQLEFNASRISLSIDGKYLGGHNEATYLPSLPLKFSMGPRVLADTSVPLTEQFSQNVDYFSVNGGAPA